MSTKTCNRCEQTTHPVAGTPEHWQCGHCGKWSPVDASDFAAAPATAEAASAMLGALESISALIRKRGIGDNDAESEPVVAGLYAAIATARSAGIKSPTEK